jgi:HrpA-like RNA helicase
MVAADKFMVLALHSSLSTEQQSRVFVHPPPGVRKVLCWLVWSLIAD